jgi:hypothetical protein
VFEAPIISALEAMGLKIMKRFQMLLLVSTCAATAWRRWTPLRVGPDSECFLNFVDLNFVDFNGIM